MAPQDETRQLTREEALAIYDSGEWESWTDEEIVKFQLYQDLLCVPFSRFHAATEAVLGRPVWTHEFGFREVLRNMRVNVEGQRWRKLSDYCQQKER